MDKCKKKSKNIVICMDGTGNTGGVARGTNVWRIYNSVDRFYEECEQITYYDDGVGTDSIRLLRLIGGAFGVGLQRKICDAYGFLAMNYEEGDRIFLFGFSRGAFTVRSLAGMICRCGLLERKDFLSAGRCERDRKVRRILGAYRNEVEIKGCEGRGEFNMQQRQFRLGIDDLPLRWVPIHFLGVWDTVDAVGGTLGGLSAWDWLWRRVFKRRWWGFHDNDPHPDIRYACQALALDDERRTYSPKVWSRPNNALINPRRGIRQPGQVIEQVWFAGAHADVGGGYAKESLSLVPLHWMMCRARERGLKFLHEKWNHYREAADPHGRLHDSRTGFRMLYRYGRRRPEVAAHLPAIHESVFERIRRGTDYYAPKVVPDSRYIVVLSDFRLDRPGRIRP
ncbi:MAG: DUF2235 domain-containing protein [Rhodospirillaceae bacterium]|nr:DUF2235 domain-containing protein [Rhodospirillaceae bacterium]